MNTGIVPTCHAPAPSAGVNVASISNVHLELRLLVVTPPAGESGSRSEVALVDVRPRHRARPGVQALVATPDGEIDAPLREVVWHDLHRVRDVESGQRVVCAGRSSESFHIDQLAAP